MKKRGIRLASEFVNPWYYLLAILYLSSLIYEGIHFNFQCYLVYHRYFPPWL